MRYGAVIAAALLLLACSRNEPAPGSGPDGVDFSLTAGLEADLQTGFFQLELRSSNPAEVFYEILDRDGSVLADALYRVRDTTCTRPERLPDVRPWTAETPELYTLHLQAGGRDSYHPVAFRRIDPYKKDSFLVNGHPVPIKDANLDGPAGRETLLALKQAGVNALNTASRPRAFRELCDSAGIYLYPRPDSLARPDPRSAAVRRAWQDVAVLPVDPESGVFRIENRRQFTSLEDYTFRWWVERDGKRLHRPWRRTLHFATAPGSAQEFGLKLPPMKKPGEYRLFFEAVARTSRPLVEKGSVRARECLLLKEGPAPEPFRGKGPLTVTEGDTRLVVRGKDVEMVFDRADGAVKSLKVKGRELLPDGLAPCWMDAPDQVQCSWEAEPDALRLHVRYLLPGARETARFTLLASGALQVESPGTAFRLQAPDSGLRYLGEGPDLQGGPLGKTLRTTAGEAGAHPDTSFLETDAFTLRGTAPFAFRSDGSRLTLIPESAFWLVPRH